MSLLNVKHWHYAFSTDHCHHATLVTIFLRHSLFPVTRSLKPGGLFDTCWIEDVQLLRQIRWSYPSHLQQCDDDAVLQVDKNTGQSLKIGRFLFFIFLQLTVLLICHVGSQILCIACNLGRIDLACWVQDTVAIFHRAFYIILNLEMSRHLIINRIRRYCQWIGNEHCRDDVGIYSVCSSWLLLWLSVISARPPLQLAWVPVWSKAF